jgi:predicted amidohydrolase
MKPFAIAALQLNLENSDNFDLIESKTRETLLRFPWVQMVVLSELAVGGASKSTEFSLEHYLPKLKDIAKDLNIWFIPGSFYDHSERGTTNSSPVISPKGDVERICHKTFPFLPYEKEVVSGSEACVFDIPDVGRFGLHICYDLWFPESARAMSLKGAEVLLHPSLTDTCDRDVEKSMVRATAAQQQCYYIDVNAGGTQGCGLSIAVGPDGEILHEAGLGDEIILIEVDFDKVHRSRKRGFKGLGQPIKSYRDNPNPFKEELKDDDYLKSLGPVSVPKRENNSKKNS